MKNRNNNSACAPTAVATEAHPCCLQDFAGAWQLSRQILQSSGEAFQFKGAANFTPSGSHFLYHESGVVTASDGRTLHAERAYLWQQGTDGKIDVLFDDNRYFHTFSAVEPTAKHLCGDDHYVVTYRFDDWPCWQSTWQVNGPRKDYQMSSLYRRT